MASTPSPLPAASFTPGTFFVLRAPVLPIESILGGDAAPPDRDWPRLREWLLDPWVQSAIYIASPSLSDRLIEWRADPNDADFESLRPALLRYYLRMCGRCTPFGLFASVSLGKLGPAGRFEIGPRNSLQPHTWLDLGYLYPLVDRAVKSTVVREQLSYTPNTTLYSHAAMWRYVEQIAKPDSRVRDLATVAGSEILNRLIEESRSGLDFPALREMVMRLAPEVEAHEADTYLHELIDIQVLVPTLAPTLTGPDPLRHLVDLSAGLSSLVQWHENLSRAEQSLRELDARASAGLRDTCKSLAESLMSQVDGSKEAQLFHADLVRGAPDLVLPECLAPEILRAVDALRRITTSAWPRASLQRFRARFAERYGDRTVPLLEVLDEDSGIGFDVDPASRRNEGILAQIRFGDSGDASAPTSDATTTHLAGLLERAWSSGSRVIDLETADIERLAVAQPNSLPDVFTVMGVLLTPASEVASSPTVFALQSFSAGLSMFGRFCRADEDLARKVRELHREEEALQPRAVFAEIVHCPADRVANIVCRPALRDKDIPYLGDSGLPPADRIAVSDLLVSIESERVILRSRTLGREVLPRNSCAHNAMAPSNASAYRFLAALAWQECPVAVGFSWDAPFLESRFLPAVRHGRILLAAASWRIDPEQSRTWHKLSMGRRREAVAKARAEYGLPRWVQVGSSDNQLLLDLDNAVCADELVEEFRRNPYGRISEPLCAPDQFVTTSPDGHHANEVMIPFVRRSARPGPAAPEPPAYARIGLEEGRRRFEPGSEWLYAKLYGSPAMTERALLSEVGPLVAELAGADLIDQWHFLRYRDPDDHMRLRLHGNPRALRDHVMPRLQELFERWLLDAGMWRCQFDTYDRETRRYGGPEAIGIAEEVFHADSHAVVELLQSVPEGALEDWRWQIAIPIIDTYYDAFGMNLEARLKHFKEMHRSFRAEFRVGKDYGAFLSERYRKERATVATLSGGTAVLSSGPLAWASPALTSLRARLAELGAGYQRIGNAFGLAAPLESIVGSLAHMHVNRLMLSNPREHEMLAYAFLERLTRARVARGG